MKKADSAFTIAMGQRMLKRRQELGLTQEEVGERARLSMTQYSLIESGNSCARADSLLSISNVLGISMDYLLTGEESHRSHQELLCLAENMSESQLQFALTMMKALLEYGKPKHKAVD